MNIALRILNWGELDANFLGQLIDELERNSSYILDDIREEIYDPYDIKEWIDKTLEFHARVIKEKLAERFPEYEKEIMQYDENIYVNYLDSGFDSAFNNVCLCDLSDEEELKQLLIDMKILEKGENNA